MSTTRQRSADPSHSDFLPRRSTWLIAAFRRYVRWYLPRHFSAVRLARDGFLPPAVLSRDIQTAGSRSLADKPVVVVLNHPSWWDPLICLVLSDLFPGRNHFAPIDAEALKQYRFFARLGFFGIRPRSVGGARIFLLTGEAILNDPRSMLWVTAQGRFADVRERPLILEGGVGHLLARCPHAVALPLAIELTFWNERLPEALGRFAEPMQFDGPMSPKQWTRALEAALEHNLDALAEAAQRRDSEAFVTLLRGRQSVAFFYDLWRATRDLLTGKSLQRGHP